MAVLLKKDEKIKAVIDLLPENFEFENFVDKFKETYPKDWKKLELTYVRTRKKYKTRKTYTNAKTRTISKKLFKCLE